MSQIKGIILYFVGFELTFPMLNIKTFTFNPFQENTYLLYDETGEGALIDPGCYEESERQELKNFIIENNIKLTQLLNTHCHIDHVLGNAWAKRTFGIPLLIHKEDLPVLKSVEAYAPNYGFKMYEGAEPDDYLKEGESIKVGNESLKIIYVPGHAPGHVVFYHEGSKKLISGDTIFKGSIGRTDLPGGNQNLLFAKIKSELFSLPEETVAYPGHGPKTTIGFEKIHNPFVGQRARS
ncbi:MBL fold metallo-hydrolase [Algoriphagus sp.]|uniref:MBL fold metallo-hydrolase n=1 Tax=Algoriphagus sp. TaxID=1872435 RepID=UPI0025F43366|nr:MBL fold metallo-hydrolase [Algoriphagus sp.]